MSELIDEWIRKADGDYATACREMSADDFLSGKIF